jgi:hypothetical protein
MIQMDIHVKLTLFTLLTIIIFQTNIFNYDLNIFAQNTNPGLETITGNYTNDLYGIKNFVIPEDWYASEHNFNNTLLLKSFPGSTREVIQNPLSENDIRIMPDISLIVSPTSDIVNMKSQSDLSTQQANSTVMSKTKCNQLEQTSNSLINNIPYNISSIKCLVPADISNVNINSYLKTYFHEKPDKTYFLGLNIYSVDDIENDDIVYYNSILDSTLKTLQIE